MKLGPRYWPLGHLKQIALPLLLVLSALVGLDQYSKSQVQESLIFYQDPTDIDLYQGRKKVVFTLGERKVNPAPHEQYFGINLNYSRNKGAAFSMLAQVDERIRRPLFNLSTLIAVVVIYFLFMGSPRERWLLRLGLVFILSGACGNFLDRLRYGYVIDFIDVEWHIFGFNHDFAVFNVADIAINIGVLLFAFDSFRQWRCSARKEASDSVSTPS